MCPSWDMEPHSAVLLRLIAQAIAPFTSFTPPFSSPGNKLVITSNTPPLYSAPRTRLPHLLHRLDRRCQPSFFKYIAANGVPRYSPTARPGIIRNVRMQALMGRRELVDRAGPPALRWQSRVVMRLSPWYSSRCIVAETLGAYTEVK